MAIVQLETNQRDRKVTSASLLMLVAGILHFIIIPHHWEQAPAHGITMGVIGALEVVWAVLYWLRPSRLLAQIGILLAARAAQPLFPRLGPPAMDHMDMGDHE